MDRELPNELRRMRWWRAHRTWIIAAVSIAILAAFALRQLAPAVERSKLSIAVVERGPIEAVVAATGTVVPIAQQSISSPVSAEIRKVLVSLGERVTEKQPLMELDKRAATLALNNLQEELALKQQELRRTDLQLSDAITDSHSKRDLLMIDLDAQDTRLQRLQQLSDSGIVSKQELLEAQLAVKRTKVEIEQVSAQLTNANARRDGELKGLGQSCALLEKKVADQERRVALASVTAPRAGIITHLTDQEGSSVSEGQELVIISGEDAFRIEATLSDFYASQLLPGQRAKVHVSQTETAPGRVVRIVPATASTQVLVFIDLDNPSAPSLRANSRVNAEIITATKPNGLRIRRGTAFEAGGVNDIYVLKGNRAVRTKVRTGLSSNQLIEIIDGLNAGDQVIVAGVVNKDLPAFAIF